MKYKRARINMWEDQMSGWMRELKGNVCMYACMYYVRGASRK